MSNINNIYLVTKSENEIIGICFTQIKEILKNKNRKNFNFGATRKYFQIYTSKKW